MLIRTLAYRVSSLCTTLIANYIQIKKKYLEKVRTYILCLLNLCNMKLHQKSCDVNSAIIQARIQTHTHTNITEYLVFLTVQFRLILHSDLRQHLQEVRKNETSYVYLRSAQPHCSFKSGREETNILMFQCSIQQNTLIPKFCSF